MKFLIILFFLGVSSGSIFALEAEEDTTDTYSWRPSPTGAALRSIFLPGWGQAYNRNPVKALVYGGIEQGLIFAVYRQHLYFRYYREKGEDRRADAYRNDRNRLTWYLTASILLSMMDAFVDAHLYQFDVSDDLSDGRKKKQKNSGLYIKGVKINFSWRFE